MHHKMVKLIFEIIMTIFQETNNFRVPVEIKTIQNSISCFASLVCMLENLARLELEQLKLLQNGLRLILWINAALCNVLRNPQYHPAEKTSSGPAIQCWSSMGSQWLILVSFWSRQLNAPYQEKKSHNNNNSLQGRNNWQCAVKLRKRKKKHGRLLLWSSCLDKLI